MVLQFLSDNNIILVLQLIIPVRCTVWILGDSWKFFFYLRISFSTILRTGKIGRESKLNDIVTSYKKKLKKGDVEIFE